MPPTTNQTKPEQAGRVGVETFFAQWLLLFRKKKVGLSPRGAVEVAKVSTNLDEAISPVLGGGSIVGAKVTLPLAPLPPPLREEVRRSESGVF